MLFGRVTPHGSVAIYQQNEYLDRFARTLSNDVGTAGTPVAPRDSRRAVTGGVSRTGNSGSLPAACSGRGERHLPRKAYSVGARCCPSHSIPWWVTAYRFLRYLLPTGGPLCMVIARVLFDPERVPFVRAFTSPTNLRGALPAVYVVGTHASCRRATESIKIVNILIDLPESPFTYSAIGSFSYAPAQKHRRGINGNEHSVGFGVVILATAGRLSRCGVGALLSECCQWVLLSV